LSAAKNPQRPGTLAPEATFAYRDAVKKVLVALAVIVVLIAVAGVWFWRSMGFTDSARLVPDSTVAFVALPDLPRTAFRWPQTTLAKIGAEPEVKAFFQKPFEFMTKSKNGNDAGETLLKLKPGHLFAALIGFSAQQNAALIGFQFWGSGHECDEAFDRIRKGMAHDQSIPLVLQKETYQGDEINASVHDTVTLYTARHGHWGFISNNLEAIKQVLDRSAGRSSGKSLTENPAYQQTFTHLPKDADFVFFAQPQSLVDALLAVGTSMGAQAIPEQVEQLRKIEGIGGTIKLDGLNLRDSIFVLRKDPPHVSDLSHAAIKFTTKETTIYFDFVADFHQLFVLSQNPTLVALAKTPAIQNSRLPALIPEAFGPECALSATWQEFQMKPNGVVAVQVRDQAKADEAVQELLTIFPQATITELAGVKTYNFPDLQGMFANPTFALHSGFLLIGLEAEDIQRAVVAASANDSLDKSPDFKSSLPEFKSANEVFGFIDTRKIFTRGYPLVKQILTFGAALMPGASDMIDAGKLPETETVARHLEPIVYSQTRFPDGYLIESRGPITLNQAVLGGAGAAGAFFKPASNP
jgi:Protein of unknown function (DUF3352)